MCKTTCKVLLAAIAIGTIATACNIRKLFQNPRQESFKCECDHNSCSCFARLKVDAIELDSILNAQVIYLSERLGISLIVDLNGSVVLDETFTVQDLQRKCFSVPMTKEAVQICIGFLDSRQSEEDEKFSSCLEAVLTAKGVRIARVGLGCFQIHALQSGENIWGYLKDKF